MPSSTANSRLDPFVKTVQISEGRDYRVLRGNLWIYSNEISGDLKDHKPGEIVKIIRHNGKFLGIGYINPHSLVAVRILSRMEEMPDHNFFLQRITNADQKRNALLKNRSIYRVVFSEGDLLPGLIIDKYENIIVLQSTTIGMDQFIPVIQNIVQELFKPAATIFRNERIIREEEAFVSRKEVLDGVYPGPTDMELNGLQFRVDLLTGQKTGLYLDQVQNYHFLKTISKDKSVLDCCCYTGGFGITAAVYGAKSVAGIDISQEALIAARINADLNHVADRCDFIAGSVFEELRKRTAQNEQYDIIILDPPSFAR
ncbi:MAG: hypothetical protein A2161_03510, partial [Candidatus Schekmanbacteria bacterium RBG_13_48_7]